MSSNQWIHCNICYYLFAKKDRRFYLMTCQHTLCKDCMAHTNRGTCCPVCKRNGLQFFEISNEMDKKAKALFDPGTTKNLEQIYKAINFQTKQKQHLIDHIQFVEEKLLKCDQMEQKLKQKIVECQQRYQKTRNYRRSKQETLRQQLSLISVDLSPYREIDNIRQSSSSNRNQLNFFESQSSSSGSNRSQLSTEKNSRNSFLHLKGSSSSSDKTSMRSIVFGNTPTSGNRSSVLFNESFHKMRIDDDLN